MIALVYFLRESRALPVESLREVVARELGIDTPLDDEKGECCVVPVAVPPDSGLAEEEVACFMVRLGDAVFTVNNFAIPYTERGEAVRGGGEDAVLRHIVEQHQAWLSVDFMGDVENEEQMAQAFDIVGRILAGLAGPDCLAVYCPLIDCLSEYDEEVPNGLRSGRPLLLFEGAVGPSGADFDGDDPRIVVAVEEARARWPEFVLAFERRGGNEPPFAVKAKFEEGEFVEYMWVVVETIDGDTIRGVLDSPPRDITGVTPGDAVVTTAGEIYDWIFPEGEGIVGAFTMKALNEDAEN